MFQILVALLDSYVPEFFRITIAFLLRMRQAGKRKTVSGLGL